MHAPPHPPRTPDATLALLTMCVAWWNRRGPGLTRSLALSSCTHPWPVRYLFFLLTGNTLAHDRFGSRLSIEIWGRRLVGVDHAASATDGIGKFYVFGGRTNGENRHSPGIAFVQVYDVPGDSWTAAEPMPFSAGGMGTCVAWSGSIYVFGGETSTPPPANDRFSSLRGVYPQTRVFDVAAVSRRKIDDSTILYHPCPIPVPSLSTLLRTSCALYRHVSEPAVCYFGCCLHRVWQGSWGWGPEMPVAVHGISPVVDPATGRVWIVGGGTNGGYGMSSVVQVFDLPVFTGSEDPLGISYPSPPAPGSLFEAKLPSGLLVRMPSVPTNRMWSVISMTWVWTWWGGTTAQLYQDGVALVTTSATAATAMMPNGICIGCDFAGEVAEVLVLDGILDQRQLRLYETMIFTRRRRSVARGDVVPAGGSVEACLQLAAGETGQLACSTPDHVITGVNFASFGRPRGHCGAFALDHDCHTLSSYEQIVDQCVGRRSCRVAATNAAFATTSCPTPFFEAVDGCCVGDANNGEGTYRFVVVRDEEECRWRCARDPDCVAYESQFNSNCEIHTAEVRLEDSCGWRCSCAAKRFHRDTLMALSVQVFCAPEGVELRPPSAEGHLQPTSPSSMPPPVSPPTWRRPTPPPPSPSPIPQSLATPPSIAVLSTAATAALSTSAPPSISSTSGSTAPPRSIATALLECTPFEANCRFCLEDGRTCEKCMNSFYRHQGVCLRQCPSGTRPIGRGRFSRVCSSEVPATTAAVDLSPAQGDGWIRCRELEDDCRFCNEVGTMCTRCQNTHYLVEALGRCLHACPPGMHGVGNGRFGRRCLPSTTLAATVGCRPRRNSCHRCSDDETVCILCRDSRYLTGAGTCETACFAGTPAGNGRYGRRCIRRDTDCVAGAQNCHACSASGCAQCRNRHYLHAGRCHQSCPEGVSPQGRGNYNRVCIT